MCLVMNQQQLKVYLMVGGAYFVAGMATSVVSDWAVPSYSGLVVDLLLAAGLARGLSAKMPPALIGITIGSAATGAALVLGPRRLLNPMS